MRAMIERAKEVVSTNSIGIIKTITAVVAIAATLTISILVGGMRLGKTESNVENICQTILALENRQEKHEIVIDELRRKQAFQEGLVTAKLDSLERAIIRIESILKEWEAVRE